MSTADQFLSAENDLGHIQLPILQNVSDAVVMTDAAFQVRFWNTAAERMYGWSAEDVLGRPSAGIFAAVEYLDGAPREAVIAQLMREGFWRGEIALTNRHGTRLIMDAASQIIRDSSGAILALVNINRDVTERKQAELAARVQAGRSAAMATFSRALAEAGLDYTAVIEMIGQQLIHLIGDCCLIRLIADDGAHFLPGVLYHRDPEAQALGRSMLADIRQRIDEGIAGRAFTTGEPQLSATLPVEQLRAVVNPAFMEFVERFGLHSTIAAPLRVGGAKLGVLAMYRAQTPAAFTAADVPFVQELADRSALAIENARLYLQAQRAIAVRDVAQRRLQVIATATRAVAAAQLEVGEVLTTITRMVSELIGDGCAVCLSADDSQKQVHSTSYHPNADALAHFQAALAAAPIDTEAGLMGQVVTTGAPLFVPQFNAAALKLDIRTPYRSYIERFGLHSLMIVPLHAQDRRIGVLVLVRDATPVAYTSDDLQLAQELADRTALAIEKARLYQRAQDAIKTREQFLSIASHELKTPLTSLLGLTYFAGRRAIKGEVLTERDQRALQMIDDQAQRINKLVNALLDITRLEAGTLTLELEPIDLCALAQQVVGELEPVLERHRLVLDCPATPIWITGDALRLEQVLGNLLSNAVKYSPTGGDVDMQLASDATHARITVRDRGIGIPAADQTRLFQQFYRAKNVDPKRISGLGIGLYIVGEIIARHGGTIEIQSTESVGSTFTVRLPLRDPAPAGADEPVP